MIGSFYLKQAVSAQEKRNNELASSTTQLYKQVSELQTRETDYKVRNDEMVANLGVVQADLEASKRESAERLERMETIMSDSILYSCVELMLEFKKDLHAKWEPDHEIELW